jgi:hypothetical protein
VRYLTIIFQTAQQDTAWGQHMRREKEQQALTEPELGRKQRLKHHMRWTRLGSASTTAFTG